MDWDQVDWTALERLRSGFLQGSAGQSDYWQTERDLASYDFTFAQRIGWKWDHVLGELSRRSWTPPSGAILDWGCGSGVAGRAFLDQFSPQGASGLLLADRSALAMQFAQRRACDRFPSVQVSIDPGGEGTFATLLLSHVLTELDDSQIELLLALARRATAVLWVEPGTREVSRKLSQLRDRLIDSFRVVAPCPHQNACGMLVPGHESDWCHHFAAPPPSVFIDRGWARFAILAGVDLRSLPLSYVVLDKRPAAGQERGGNVRVIGRPRVYKAHALVFGCDAGGLHERRLSKRTLPEIFRQLKKGKVDSLQNWSCDGDEIRTMDPALGESIP